MIDPELIEQLKASGFPMRKRPLDFNVHPIRTYIMPTEADLFHALGDDFKTLEKTDMGWEALDNKVYNDLEGSIGIGKFPLEALIKLYIAVHKK